MSIPPDGPAPNRDPNAPQPTPNAPQPTPNEQPGEAFSSTPPARHLPVEGYEAPDARESARATFAPGVALIILGLLGLPWILYEIVNTAVSASPKAGEFLKESMDKQRDEFTRQNPGQPYPLPPLTASEWTTVAVTMNATLGGLALITTVILTFGGIRMIQRRSYTLCVTAAITAMLPCISCTGCVLGQVVGVWAIMVLLRPEVKELFRTTAQERSGSAPMY